MMTPLISLRSRALSLAAAVVGLLAATVLSAPVAQAESKDDDSLTWHGVTLYGIVDVGVQFETHGAPESDYFNSGFSDIVQPNSNHSVAGVAPNNLSHSRVGLTGKQPLSGDWSGVFKVETFFNPQSGQLTDALKSLVQNNGRAAANQYTGIDSSIAGEPFMHAYAGVSSPTYGTITFGRQQTVLADGFSKYDPQGLAYAFSFIGLSGTPAGGGATQDRRFDRALKYQYDSHGWRLGLIYQFNGYTGAGNTAYQASIGTDFAGLSVDAYASKVRSAIAASALSAGQAAELSSPVTGPALQALGISMSNALSGTVSDNTSAALMAKYKLGTTTAYAAYELITYRAPSTPLAAGFDDLGYKLAFVNNTKYAKEEKILQVFWAGLKFQPTSAADYIVAAYGQHQSAYATGAAAGCSSFAISGACSGNFYALSAAAVLHLAKHFDGYAGAMWSEVADGLANGYISHNTIDPTIGVRYSF